MNDCIVVSCNLLFSVKQLSLQASSFHGIVRGNVYFHCWNDISLGEFSIIPFSLQYIERESIFIKLENSSKR